MKQVINCDKCGNTGRLLVNGVPKTCTCEIQRSFALLKEYTPTGPQPIWFRKALNMHITEQEKLGKPVRIFLVGDGTERNENPDNYYKSLFAYYLIKTTNYLDFVSFNLQRAMDLYYERPAIMNPGGGSDDGIQMFYNIKPKTIVLSCISFYEGDQILNVLRTFLETYMDRNILVYLHKNQDFKKTTTYGKQGSKTTYGPASVFRESEFGFVNFLTLLARYGI